MQSFEGSLSSASSAAAHPVEVRLSDMGVDINAPGGQRHIWLYEQIESSSPLSPGGEVLISTASEPDSRLLVKHREFAQALLDQAPQLSKKVARKRLLIPMFAATAAIVLIGSYLWLSETSYSQNLARMIPKSTWNSLGEQIIGSISGNKKTCNQGPGQAALGKLVKRLNTGRNKRNFKVKVVDLRVVNAFAAPGENILISGKLIGFVKSPDEIAGVLAHEMGHGIENDPEAGLIRALGISAAMSVLLGGTSDNMASIGSLLLQMNYSRKAERRADEHALEILQKAAIAPQPLADFFKRIEKKITEKTGKLARTALSVIGSHPATKERVENIENAAEWSATPALTAAEWKALQHICD